MTSPELDPNVTAAIEDSFAKQGLMRTIGAELHLVASGEVRLRINASESLTQHHGFLHARASSDDDFSIRQCTDPDAHRAADAIEAQRRSPSEYKLNLLRPALQEHIFEDIGTVVRAGTTLTAAEAAFYHISTIPTDSSQR